MINYNIQNVGIESVEQLSTVATQAYLDHYTHLWKNANADWYIQKSFSIEALTNELKDDNNAFYILKNEDTPLGFFKIVKSNPLSINGFSEQNALYFERVYFIKEAIGQGFGEIAFNFTQHLARQWGKKLIWLTAMDTSMKPIEAYKRMGFEICGTKKLDFPLLKDSMRGMVIMKKKL